MEGATLAPTSRRRIFELQLMFANSQTAAVAEAHRGPLVNFVPGQGFVVRHAVRAEYLTTPTAMLKITYQKVCENATSKATHCILQEQVLHETRTHQDHGADNNKPTCLLVKNPKLVLQSLQHLVLLFSAHSASPVRARCVSARRRRFSSSSCTLFASNSCCCCSML